MAKQPFRIVFAVYPGMTQLDFTGPHQFLSRLPVGEVIIASPAGGDVPSGGLIFAGTRRLVDIASCDLICVPGGGNATSMALDSVFVTEVRRLGLEARYVTSVCTGSLILGAAGLLAGRRAAYHWAWRYLLPLFGAIADDGRVVRDGNVITGGGVTAGIDFALAVLAEIGGAELAQTIQLGLDTRQCRRLMQGLRKSPWPRFWPLIGNGWPAFCHAARRKPAKPLTALALEGCDITSGSRHESDY